MAKGGKGNKGGRKAGGERYGGGWDSKDSAAKTGASRKDTSRAFHDARDTAAREGGWNIPKDRHNKGSSGK